MGLCFILCWLIFTYWHHSCKEFHQGYTEHLVHGKNEQYTSKGSMVDRSLCHIISKHHIFFPIFHHGCHLSLFVLIIAWQLFVIVGIQEADIWLKSTLTSQFASYLGHNINILMIELSVTECPLMTYNAPYSFRSNLLHYFSRQLISTLEYSIIYLFVTCLSILVRIAFFFLLLSRSLIRYIFLTSSDLILFNFDDTKILRYLADFLW